MRLAVGEAFGSLAANISKKVSLFRSIGQTGANILGGREDINGIRHGSDAGLVAAGFLNPMGATTSLINDIKVKNWKQFALDLLLPGFGVKKRNDKLKEERAKEIVYNGVNILLNAYVLLPIAEYSNEKKVNLSLLEVFNTCCYAQRLKPWIRLPIQESNISSLSAINIGLSRIGLKQISKEQFKLSFPTENKIQNINSLTLNSLTDYIYKLIY